MVVVVAVAAAAAAAAAAGRSHGALPPGLLSFFSLSLPRRRDASGSFRPSRP